MSFSKAPAIKHKIKNRNPLERYIANLTIGLVICPTTFPKAGIHASLLYKTTCLKRR